MFGARKSAVERIFASVMLIFRAVFLPKRNWVVQRKNNVETRASEFGCLQAAPASCCIKSEFFALSICPNLVHCATRRADRDLPSMGGE